MLKTAQSKIENGIGKERIEELLKTLKDIEKLILIRR